MSRRPLTNAEAATSVLPSPVDESLRWCSCVGAATVFVKLKGSWSRANSLPFLIVKCMLKPERWVLCVLLSCYMAQGTYCICRAGFQPIGPVASSWAPHWKARAKIKIMFLLNHIEVTQTIGLVTISFTKVIYLFCLFICYIFCLIPCMPSYIKICVDSFGPLTHMHFLSAHFDSHSAIYSVST